MDPDEFDPGQRIINRKLNMDQMNTLKNALVKYTKNRSYYNEESNTQKICASGCSMKHVFRCRIDGKIENENVYYMAYSDDAMRNNKVNKDEQLWVYINSLCDKLATNDCSGNVPFKPDEDEISLIYGSNTLHSLIYHH